MKVATYNIRFGGRIGYRIHWHKILDTVEPDIFLLQETFHPEQYMSAQLYELNRPKIVWAAVGENKWGSGLWVKSGQVKPIDVSGFEGWVAAAEVENFTWGEKVIPNLIVFSIHAPKREFSNYVIEVNKILDFIAQRFSNTNLVIGGDFNLTVGIRHETEFLKNTKQEFLLLERIKKEFGLINCWQAAHPNSALKQTLRWSRDLIRPLHCDGIFVPLVWYKSLQSCEILDSKEWDLLSDHNPVVATFE